MLWTSRCSAATTAATCAPHRRRAASLRVTPHRQTHRQPHHRCIAVHGATPSRAAPSSAACKEMDGSDGSDWCGCEEPPEGNCRKGIGGRRREGTFGRWRGRLVREKRAQGKRAHAGGGRRHNRRASGCSSRAATSRRPQMESSIAAGIFGGFQGFSGFEVLGFQQFGQFQYIEYFIAAHLRPI